MGLAALQFIVRREEFVKPVFARFIAAFMASVVLGACSSEPNAVDHDGSIRVLTPSSDSQGKYTLQMLTLQGVTDLQQMAGQFARFFLSPRIIDNHLDGPAPQTRFVRNQDGEYIPSNEMTQQLSAVYYHMQQLANIDKEMGVGEINHWPRDIGVAVRIKGVPSNNAFYDGVTDSMLFVPYTKDEMPIAINGGILAHEHFHSLFFKIVMPDSPYRGGVHDRSDFLKETGIVEELSQRKKLDILPFDRDYVKVDKDSLHFYYHLALMRGLNEGLADFWGWMYSGDPDFIAQSLPSEKSRRSLRVDEEATVNFLSSMESLQRSIKQAFTLENEDKAKVRNFAIGHAYTLASQYSRVLKRFTDIYRKERAIEDMQARKEIAKTILAMLPQMHTDFAQLGENYYSPVLFLERFVAALNGNLQEKECLYITQVMVNSSEESDIKYSCKNESGWKIQKEKVVSDAPKSSVTKGVVL